MTHNRYTQKTSEPPEGWVTTREAARMWGCSPKSIREWMQEAGISPIMGRSTQRQGRSYYWDPAEVMAVRAIHAKRRSPVPNGLTQKERRWQEAHQRGRIAVFQQKRLEWLREYYLDKAKRKRGEP